MPKTPQEIYQILGDRLGYACVARNGCPYGKAKPEEYECRRCKGTKAESWQRMIEGDTNE